jgi:FSR family fosmidomycin resistance protein-like MFS transporter
MSPALRSCILRSTVVFTFTLLLIEFLDEFVFGAREAAWPLMHTDLGLSYAQIGLLLGVPGVVSSLVEPVLGILGDVWRRRALILGGGVVFALALLLTALSHDFPVLLISFILFYPASGAFVTLSQATLMDTDLSRHEQNMARWTLAGSLGVVAGPIALSAAATLGLGWRGSFLVFAALALVLLAMAYRTHPPRLSHSHNPDMLSFKIGVLNALRALRRPRVLHWLTLLQLSDLMLDVLLGFLALYFVDVVGATPAWAGTAVALWAGTGLLGNLLLIPLLERVRGLHYLRLSAVLESALFSAFLLVPSVWAKFVLLGLLGLFSAGWYSILQAQLYSVMPGQSGTVMTVGNVFGLLGAILPLGLGLVAEQFDLVVAMWLLLLGPVALVVGLPRHERRPNTCQSTRGDQDE